MLHGEQQREDFWSLDPQIAGKVISDTLSDCRSIACTSFVCSDSKFHGETGGGGAPREGEVGYEIEFFNSIQDWFFTTVYRL